MPAASRGSYDDGMYQPPAFVVEDRSIVLDLLRRRAFGHLVTAGPETGPGVEATAVPFVVDDELTTLRAHVARANRHWRSIGTGIEALLIVPGVDAYVSPRWYPSKADDPKVVPTWNYEVVHLRGPIRVVDDAEGKLDIVRALTDHNEAATVEPGGTAWAVSDAPDDFITRQLRAIVGLALTIESIEATGKLSQNRAEPDRLGVIAGLAGSTDPTARATGERMATPPSAEWAADEPPASAGP